MCDACLAGYTKGAVLDDPTPQMVEAVGLIGWVYEQDWGGVGGPFHIVTDDHNLEDTWFEDETVFSNSRIDWKEEGLSPDDMIRCERLYSLLKEMTEAQRAFTMVMVDEAR